VIFWHLVAAVLLAVLDTPWVVTGDELSTEGGCDSAPPPARSRGPPLASVPGPPDGEARPHGHLSHPPTTRPIRPRPGPKKPGTTQ
jgi:hypothetical protein